MDDAEGPGSQEPGPSVSSEPLETLRRRLYARGGSSDALRDYLGAEAALVPDARLAAAVGSTEDDPTSAPPPRRGARRRTIAVLTVLATAAVIGALGWWTLGAGPSLPESIAPPAAAGRTLLYHSRQANPLSAPDKVTFDPANERMLFRADGHRLTVVLRCVGRGTVRITAAEQHLDVRCGDSLQTFTKHSPGAVHGPFLILGRTVGDVVWGMRLTSAPIPA